jgi:hypothetical protein
MEATRADVSLSNGEFRFQLYPYAKALRLPPSGRVAALPYNITGHLVDNPDNC